MNASTELRRAIARATADAIGSDQHIVVGLLFPKLPSALRDQVARERREYAAAFAARMALVPPIDVTARVAYLRVRCSGGAR